MLQLKHDERTILDVEPSALQLDALRDGDLALLVHNFEGTGFTALLGSPEEVITLLRVVQENLDSEDALAAAELTDDFGEGDFPEETNHEPLTIVGELAVSDTYPDEEDAEGYTVAVALGVFSIILGAKAAEQLASGSYALIVAHTDSGEDLNCHLDRVESLVNFFDEVAEKVPALEVPAALVAA